MCMMIQRNRQTLCLTLRQELSNTLVRPRAESQLPLRVFSAGYKARSVFKYGFIPVSRAKTEQNVIPDVEFAPQKFHGCRSPSSAHLQWRFKAHGFSATDEHGDTVGAKSFRKRISIAAIPVEQAAIKKRVVTLFMCLSHAVNSFPQSGAAT